MDPYRIILADNHAPLRQELRRMLDERSDLEIAGEVGESLDLLNLLRSIPAGPLIVICKIKTVHPETKVLILSMHEDVEYLSQALSTGAEGYLIIESVDKELLRAIETIREGKVYVPPVLAGNFRACNKCVTSEIL
jgi:two-component system response regulator NreC